MIKQKLIERNVRSILKLIGEDPKREGLEETPKRVAKMYKELLSGYDQDPAAFIKAFEHDNGGGKVKVSGIYFTSLCEHHLLPFMGTVDIEYQPNGKVLGLSKFGRIVDIYAKRLQLQERMTHQITEAIFNNLKPAAVKVTIKAEHLCMSIRGVQKRGAVTSTEYQLGDFSA